MSGKSPLRALLDVRPGERLLAASMAGYFFLVISIFWVLKPIKKAVFVQTYDQVPFDLLGWELRASQAELVAKVLNMVVAALAVVVFSALARRFQREKLTLVFSAFFVVTLGVYAFLLDEPGPLTVWSFYLYGDLWTTLMVATFFAFLNDAVAPSAAKRLYGLVVLGGVAGGAFGTSVLRLWIESVSTASWIWICLGATVFMAALAWFAGRQVAHAPVAPRDESEPPAEALSEGNPAFEGAALVFRSPYLLSIVAIVGVYEIVSTILDFQFTETITHYLDGDAIGTQFATVFTITNVVSLVVQLLLTTVVMKRFPLVVALMITPVIIALASGAFLLAPVLWVGSLLNTSDNAFNYSINQSAREALYTPTSRDEKYKAKAFIDMFVQRFAKALAVGVSLLITTLFTDFESLRWLSVFTLVMVAVWAIAAFYGGKRFATLTGGEPED